MALEGLAARLSAVLLFAPGAFFAYPWKPAMQALCGDCYATAYSFFRRDHSDAVNLSLHVIALFWTLLGNFGMLAELDLLTAPYHGPFGPRPLALLTATVTSVTLACSAAPPICTAASVLCIGVAFGCAPLLGSPEQLELAAVAIFVLVLVGGSLASGLRRSPKQLCAALGKTAAYFGLALGLRLGAVPWRGALSDFRMEANAGCAAAMVGLAMLPKPTTIVVLGGLLIVRPVGELTQQPWLLWYGQAFIAQLSQGVSHFTSGQQATLLSHEKSQHARALTLRFEWSHVVYFSNLVFHSVHESLAGKRLAGHRVS